MKEEMLSTAKALKDIQDWSKGELSKVSQLCENQPSADQGKISLNAVEEDIKKWSESNKTINHE